MNPLYRLSTVLLLSLPFSVAQANTNGHNTHNCDRPAFSEFQPATNKYLQSFNEFSLTASANTTPASIAITVTAAGEVKYHFSAKNLQITPQQNGRLAIKGKLDKAVEQGFARLSITAHSKPNCEKTEGYLIRIH